MFAPYSANHVTSSPHVPRQIPVGMPYSGKLLESIVRRTHNGKYVSPQSFLREPDEVVPQNCR